MVRQGVRYTPVCDLLINLMKVATLLLGGLSSAVALAAPHPRVVSINPCVDAVLVRIAEPQQIAGISHYSQDPRASSIAPEIARRFHSTAGTAEEVIALAPELVISGPHVSPATIRALERLHMPLLKLGVPESVAESLTQIRQLGAMVGAPERGEALIAQIEIALAAARPPDRQLIDALIWQRGGLVPGAGTLADELLRRTGYRNLSAAYGLQKWDVLPLEYLIATPPAVVFSVSSDESEHDRMSGHPVLRGLAQRVAFRPYSFRLLQCGGPTIIDAVTQFAAIRRGLHR